MKNFRGKALAVVLSCGMATSLLGGVSLAEASDSQQHTVRASTKTALELRTGSLPELSSTSKVYVLGAPAEVSVKSTNGQKIGNATFYAMPKGSEGALTIAPDVASDLGISKSGFLSSSDLAKVSEALTVNATGMLSPISRATPKPEWDDASTSWYAPPGGGWSGTWQRRISQISADGKYYSWSVDSESNGTICGQGTGWYSGYNGSQFGKWEVFYPLGCGTSGYKRVPWDNVLAYPKFQAKSTSVALTGVPGLFS
ncbi:hypothetical protein [Psychromicrobium sp. YIM B11713]|uniref:hypothetical protein n=1 Tax=Psychromicrobium sp. YIM B11713 TaxID=3145233 RepID=UPI00374FA538